jgi:hypothetical protein
VWRKQEMPMENTPKRSNSGLLFYNAPRNKRVASDETGRLKIKKMLNERFGTDDVTKISFERLDKGVDRDNIDIHGTIGSTRMSRGLIITYSEAERRIAKMLSKKSYF